MTRRLDGSLIQSGTITSTQLSPAVANSISAGGGPRVTSLIYPGNDTAGNTVGGQTVYVVGSGFETNNAIYINGNAVPSKTFISASNISFTTPALSTGIYPVYVINTDTGATAIFVPGYVSSAEPSWVTGATLSSVEAASAWNIQLSATGDGAITYALAGGSSLPAGITLAANGLISGTLSSPPAEETQYSFTVIASDSQNQDASRAFTVTASVGEGVLFANNVLLIHADGMNNGNNHSFLDSSNNNFTITRNGNATQGSFSPFSQTGWSAYFDGTGDYLTAPDNPGLQIGSSDFTIEFWMRPTGSGVTTVFGKGFTGSGAILMQTTASNRRMELWINGSLVIAESTGTFAADKWYHVAAVRNGTSLVLYRDGVSVGSNTNSTNINNNATFGIGGDPTNTTYTFTGYISNFRLVKGNAVYTSAFTPPTSPLTAIGNTSLLTCNSNRFKNDGGFFSIVNAKVYSTYNGGTRSNNYTVQYSSDNVSWTNAFSGIMESASQCGLVTGTGGGGSYGSYKYWKYIVGTAVVQHHPRASRIVLTGAGGVDHTITTFASDNCSDSGGIPTNGDSYILSGDFAITRNGGVSTQAFSPFAPTAAYTTANVGGSVYLDGTDDYLLITDNAAFDFGSGNFTIECWAYTELFASQYNVLVCQWGSSTAWVFRIQSSLIGLYANIGGTQNYTASVTNTTGQWDHFAVTRSGTTLTFYKNGVSVGTTTISGTINNATDNISIGVLTDFNPTTIHKGYISGLRVIKGSAVAPTITSPPTNVANTSLLCNFTNAQIFDQTAKTVLECIGDAKVSTAQYKYGTASIYLDGSGDWLKIPRSALFDFGTGDFTVETWVRFNTVGVDQAILAGDGTTGGYDILYRTGIGLVIGRYNTAFDNTFAWSPSINTWYHIAWCRSGTSLRAFVDGVQIGSTVTNSIAYNGGAVFNSIGTSDNGSNRLLNGYLDDYRITKGYARYTSNFTPPTSALRDK